jgi:hypothetical protein
MVRGANLMRVISAPALKALFFFGVIMSLSKKLKGYVAPIGVSLLAFAGSVHAAVPSDVTQALQDMKDDGVSIATGVLSAIIAIYAFKLVRRAL